MKLYGIPTCGSVKNAQKFLKDRGYEFEFVDFKKYTPTEQQLKEWEAKSSLSVLLNTKGTKFRTLGLDKSMSDEQKREWLLKEPMLFKRPVIELDNGKLIVGYDENGMEEHFPRH